MAIPVLPLIPASPSLTDDGRAEYQALRAEIVERLRAQQQVMNYVVLLLTGTAAGALALAGRIDVELIGHFLSTSALLPLTTTGLLFAALAAVFTEHEVMVSFAGTYIAQVLCMPWEHAYHGRPRDPRDLVAKILMGTLFAGKYLLAMAPALLVTAGAAAGVAGAPGIWAGDAPGLLLWGSRVLWLLTCGILLACLGGVVAAIRRYWTAAGAAAVTGAAGAASYATGTARRGDEPRAAITLTPALRRNLVPVRRLA